MPHIDADPIQIQHPEDWQMLVDSGLTTVVDPLVYRAGEIFLRGRSGKELGAAQDPPMDEKRAWAFLDRNLITLGFFFDALVLNDSLPVFNYGDSFDMQLNFQRRAFAAINDAAQNLVMAPVEVNYGAYVPIKQKALAELKERLIEPNPAGGAWMPAEQAKSIVDELAKSAYHWDVDLGYELEQLLPSELDRQMGRFLVGGMIFGHYADLMKSEHWLQPNRARLFVRATTGGAAPNTEDEKQLFEWLARQYGLPALSTWQPTFFHHILESAKTLGQIPGAIMKLRNSGAVGDYRAWRAQALHEWRTAGGLSEDTARTIERLKTALSRQAPGLAAAGDAGVALVESAVKPGLANVAKAAVKTAPLLGWALDRYMPGRRHVKLLADSLHTRDRYPHVERAVRSLWAG